MRDELHSPASLDDAAAWRWRALAEQAVEPNPFLEEPFVRAAARRLGAPPLELLVVAGDDGEWRACVPIALERRWRRRPGAWAAVWRHAYSFLGSPLVHRDDATHAAEALVRAAGRRWPRRVLVLDWQRADGPLSAAIGAGLEAAAARPRRYERFERALLERRPEPDYLEATLRPHHRRELKRLGRRLGEELGGEAELAEVSSEDDAVGEFLRLEATGWKGEGGTALASHPSHAQLFREVCAAFRAEGRLQLLALRAGGRTAAMLCCLAAGDTLFQFKIASDPQLARFSPGVQLEFHAVSHFHEEGRFQRVDSCADPDNAMINRLWPDRTAIETLLVPGTGRAAGATLGVLRTADRLRDVSRRKHGQAA